MPVRLPTLLLDDIFDPDKGWTFPQHVVPISTILAPDGNVNYVLSLGRATVRVFEQSRWLAGAEKSVSPARIVIQTSFPGVVINQPVALLRGTLDASGLPSFGIDSAGVAHLQAAFPISADFSVEVARRQVLACLAIVFDEAQHLWAAWTQSSTSEFDWETVRNVASVVGVLLRAFFSDENT